MKTSVLGALTSMPIRYLNQLSTAMEVEIALYQIARITGQPVELFRADALGWCAERAASYGVSLDWAIRRILAGDPPPWQVTK